MRILIAIGLVCLLVGSFIVISNNYNDNPIETKEKLFHGPVPQGYDLEHFSKTGEMIKINSTGGNV